jgi:hypothetical protein
MNKTISSQIALRSTSMEYLMGYTDVCLQSCGMKVFVVVRQANILRDKIVVRQANILGHKIVGLVSVYEHQRYSVGLFRAAYLKNSE